MRNHAETDQGWDHLVVVNQIFYYIAICYTMQKTSLSLYLLYSWTHAVLPKICAYISNSAFDTTYKHELGEIHVRNQRLFAFYIVEVCRLHCHLH